MKILAVVCNVVMFGFTCLVILTDGVSAQAMYIIFTLLLLLVPLFNVAVISKLGDTAGWMGIRSRRKLPDESGKGAGIPAVITRLTTAGIVCNIVLFAFGCWAIARAFPHPEESGVIEFTLVVILTPIISSAVIFFGRPKDGWSTRASGTTKPDEPHRPDDGGSVVLRATVKGGT